MAKQFICTTTYPIVETKQGKIRGFVEDGTFKYYGIKYANAKRWEMPTDPDNWDGVKDALGYGYTCPLLMQDVPGAGEMKVPHRYWPQDENCQYLNIWTQSIDSKAKKPVMVWLHGGGFFAGSGIEQQAYDGTNLSVKGDVVVVTINHRLNILGYLDLSEYGKKYWNSANVGSADMVAALKWIHENIAGFGGDPDNVTLFGQSGGGMKVYSLMNTPAADGLFHKGIVMSGVMDYHAPAKKPSRKPLVDALLKETGCKNVDALAKLPFDELGKAYNKVAPKLREKGEYVGAQGPEKNEWYPGDPFEVGWTEHAKTIPMMAGTVLCEFLGFMPGRPDRHTMNSKVQKEFVEQFHKGHSKEVMAAFKKAYPGKTVSDLCAIDTVMRPATKKLINMHAKVASAPTYSYVFAWEFPLDEGAGAWHCSDIPFAFANAELVPVCNVPGVSDRLEHQYASAYLNFAKYGNPSDPSLPQWPACTAKDEYTMIFDTECEVRKNYDNKLMELCKEFGPKFNFGAVKVEH